LEGEGEERNMKTNQAEPQDRREKRSGPSSHWTLMVLFASLLLDLLGFTVILPLIPSLLEYYGRADQSGMYSVLMEKVDSFRTLIGAPDVEKFNIVLLGGLLGSLFSFLQFLTSPLLGASSDIYGRKRVLILCMVGISMSYALWAVSRSFPLFVLARIVAGFSKGNIGISTAVVVDVTPVDKRNRGMAVIGIAFSCGFLIGPLIGAGFSVWGKRVAEAGGDSFTVFQYPALFALTLSLLAILLLLSAFPETLPPEKRARSLGQGVLGTLYLINPLSLFRFDAISRLDEKDVKSLRRLGLGYFLYLFLFSGLEYSLTFLTHQRFNYTRMDQGKMFLFIGLVMILVQGGYVRTRLHGCEKKTALQGMLVIIPSLLLVGWASTPLMLYSGLFLYSFAAGSVVTCLSSIASQFGEGDEKGKVMGIFRSLGALARAVGPITACTVFWSWGACVLYMVGAVLMLVPLAIISLARPHPAAAKKD
jgi:MFS family permease